MQVEFGNSWVRHISTRILMAKPKRVTVMYTEGLSWTGLCAYIQMQIMLLYSWVYTCKELLALLFITLEIQFMSMRLKQEMQCCFVT